MKWIKSADLALTLLILWSHISMTFWINNPVATWSMEGVSNIETIRKVADFAIIAILALHAFDLLFGKRVWPQFQLDRWLNYSLIGLLTILMFPYLRLWFLYFYYAGIWMDLMRTVLYLSGLALWIIETIKRKASRIE